jgi:hypothetical protein
LLLILLPVFADIPGSRDLLTVCCLVVFWSVLIHGLSPMVLLREPRNTVTAIPPGSAAAAEDAGETRQSVCSVPVSSSGNAEFPITDGEYISFAELDTLQRSGTVVLVVDARTERTFSESSLTIPEAMRLHPDHAPRDAERQQIPYDAVLAVLCA